ncbi:2-hydroxychromene-2-carboxylate isomerase [Tianweitania sediminis]|uniref:2-hydroxychromene-2-carboxylate isomerase n=1 Tax=Tianweitania sediminis TaxID=1502156 RepID=A0A8J7R3Z2_9HYPH|nr:2-hydroxychromene-2-carboxylate isomerase [Tianweitania sediminis]MBP0440191.1 2-hydroxychromene-2-carboxylate isomerase [Tianweitania sediminis]
MGPIDFFFDFASPYAYCAVDEIERIGAEFQREVRWQPILMWAVLKAHGIPAPMDVPAKRRYFLHDMERSAAFYGLPYREPVKLPLSSHLAARLWYVARESDPDAAARLGRRLFTAFFAEQRDIQSESVLAEVASECGIPADAVQEALNGQTGRTLLQEAVQWAVDQEVIGSPFFLVDGEGFFGADRLPQLRRFLAQTTR